MTTFIWMPNKQKRRVHIGGSDGKTLCKAENSGPHTAARLNMRSQSFPGGRRLCQICEELNGGATLDRRDALLVKARSGALTVFEKIELQQALVKMAKGEKRQREVAGGFYFSWEWKKLRYEALKFYGAVCMLCKTTENIVVDHIKPRSKYPALELDPNNLQVLCKQCNMGKGNHDETDFRPAKPEPELAPEQMEHLKAILQ